MKMDGYHEMWVELTHNTEKIIEDVKKLIVMTEGTSMQQTHINALRNFERDLEYYRTHEIIKCDNCGEQIYNKDSHPVYDENFNLQEGLHQCNECLIN